MSKFNISLYLLRSQKIITSALYSNDFLEHLDKSQVNAIVDYMKIVNVNAGDYVIQEGDFGDGIYVVKGIFIFKMFIYKFLNRGVS